MNLEHFLSFFYTGGEWTPFSIGMLVFRILLLISCCLFVLSVFLYLKKYKILQAFYVKLTGNAREYDRIRRTQMKAELQEKRSSFTKKKKGSLISSVYALIKNTGIVEKVPGFSESGFIILVLLLALLVFFCTWLRKGFVVGCVSGAAVLLIVWYSLSLAAYSRKVRLERQLLQFTNACASASMQYANVIDIFGFIYEQFSAPLKEGLEACYVEAKQTNNKEMALYHLKEKYDSSQFAFVIDNLELCSSATGDYYTVARDIAETVSIYSASHERKRVTLRNAKINITAMFVIGIGILYSLSIFLGTLTDVIFNTTAGNISVIVLVLVYLYGLNMKADKE